MNVFNKLATLVKKALGLIPLNLHSNYVISLYGFPPNEVNDHLMKLKKLLLNDDFDEKVTAQCADTGVFDKLLADLEAYDGFSVEIVGHYFIDGSVQILFKNCEDSSWFFAKAEKFLPFTSGRYIDLVSLLGTRLVFAREEDGYHICYVLPPE